MASAVGLERIAVDPASDTAADVARKFGARVDSPQFFAKAVVVPLRAPAGPSAPAPASATIAVGDWLTYTADDGSAVPAIVRGVHDDADHWDFTVALQPGGREIQTVESRLSERPAPRALPLHAPLADCGVECGAILCLGPPLGRGGTWTRELTFSSHASTRRPRRSSLMLPLLHPRTRRIPGGALVARRVMRFLPRLRRVALLHSRSSVCWIGVEEGATLARPVRVRRALRPDRTTAVPRAPTSARALCWSRLLVRGPPHHL